VQASFDVLIKLKIYTLFLCATTGKETPLKKNEELILKMHYLSC